MQGIDGGMHSFGMHNVRVYNVPKDKAAMVYVYTLLNHSHFGTESSSPIGGIC